MFFSVLWLPYLQYHQPDSALISPILPLPMQQHILLLVGLPWDPFLYLGQGIVSEGKKIMYISSIVGTHCVASID
jgi:hypothetical protein